MEVSLAIQRDRIATAEQGAARYAELSDAKLVSRSEIEAKRAELLGERSRMQELRRERIALVHQIASLRRDLEVADLGGQKRNAEIGREILTLRQERNDQESRRTLVVTAPVSGTVTSILAERGQMVGARAPLLSILPGNARLQAKLLVPSRAIGDIAMGDTVSLRYQAFPYQRFGSFKGAVIEISKTLIGANELDMPVTLSEPVYRVTVELQAQHIGTGSDKVQLQAGMQLEADVPLERRRLIQWLFEPLLGAMKRT